MLIGLIDLIDLLRPFKAKYVQNQIRLFHMFLIVASSSIWSWKMEILTIDLIDLIGRDFLKFPEYDKRS